MLSDLTDGIDSDAGIVIAVIAAAALLFMAARGVFRTP